MSVDGAQARQGRKELGTSEVKGSGPSAALLPAPLPTGPSSSLLTRHLPPCTNRISAAFSPYWMRLLFQEQLDSQLSSAKAIFAASQPYLDYMVTVSGHTNRTHMPINVPVSTLPHHHESISDPDSRKPCRVSELGMPLQTTNSSGVIHPRRCAFL